jgi:methylated-DNA-[protein]-cysteine S-methyltransferase
MLLHYDEFDSPIGRLLFVSDGESICALGFPGYDRTIDAWLGRRFGAFDSKRGSDPQNLRSILRMYFDGDLHAFDATPVDTGGTTFQEQVWETLRTIPAGGTWSYSQLAMRIGRPRAVRAVGHANGQNPVAIIVPCHRVIGASSALTGYGGGLERKRWLLQHEGALSRELGLGAGA